MGQGKITVILGAGFSRNIGVPTQDAFLEQLIKPCDWLTGPEKKIDEEITKRIREFLNTVFFWSEEGALPTLESVFTFIDLSAENGHNLGKDYYPGKLRAVRRFLIYKIFTILDKTYAESTDGEAYINGFIQYMGSTANYITLNWDIVLEKFLARSSLIVDYGINTQQIMVGAGRVKLCGSGRPLDDAVNVAKIHGSSNWVYCDNCKTLFYDLDEKVAKRVYAGIYVEDIKRFYLPGKTPNDLKEVIREYASLKECPTCKCSLGTHIATFSYRKSFRTNYFSNAWNSAEQYLSEAKKWIFVGYSLPDADFEFKHILKCAQMRGATPKEIHVVVKSDIEAAKRFVTTFGKQNVQCFQEGLGAYTKDIGAKP